MTSAPRPGRALAAILTGGMLIPASLACGGGSKPLSHDQLVQRGNAACKKANDAVTKLKRPTSAPEVETFLERTRMLGSTQIDELAGLKPAKRDAKGLDRFVADQRKALGKVDELKTAVQHRDAARAQAIGREVASIPSNADANALGLTECSRSVRPEG